MFDQFGSPVTMMIIKHIITGNICPLDGGIIDKFISYIILYTVLGVFEKSIIRFKQLQVTLIKHRCNLVNDRFVQFEYYLVC